MILLYKHKINLEPFHIQQIKFKFKLKTNRDRNNDQYFIKRQMIIFLTILIHYDGCYLNTSIIELANTVVDAEPSFPNSSGHPITCGFDTTRRKLYSLSYSLVPVDQCHYPCRVHALRRLVHLCQCHSCSHQRKCYHHRHTILH